MLRTELEHISMLNVEKRRGQQHRETQKEQPGRLEHNQERVVS